MQDKVLEPITLTKMREARTLSGPPQLWIYVRYEDQSTNASAVTMFPFISLMLEPFSVMVVVPSAIGNGQAARTPSKVMVFQPSANASLVPSLALKAVATPLIAATAVVASAAISCRYSLLVTFAVHDCKPTTSPV